MQPLECGHAGLRKSGGLNPKRVLVLLNGKRVVQSQANGGIAGAVDLNILPQSLVRNVDVVTGGASAAYGSDALTGVLNFVLDTELTGFKGEVRGGRTRYGDNENYDGSLAYGTGFADGRGHVIASGEYFHTDGIYDYSERPFANGVANIANCPLPQTSVSCPTRVVDGPVLSSALLGGLSPGCHGIARPDLTNGQIRPFPFGRLRNTGTMVGGGIDEEQGRYFNFVPASTRRSGYVRGEFDLTPDWKVHGDVLFGDAKNRFHGLPSYTGLAGAFTLYADNPYLPASVRAQMGGPGGTSALLYNPATGLFNGPRVNTLTIGRLNLDLPQQESIANTLRALRDAWRHSGEGMSGPTPPGRRPERELHTTGGVTNLCRAIDSWWSGVIGCRTVTPSAFCAHHTGNGCVPLNVVWQGTPCRHRLINGSNLPPASLVQKLKQDAFEVAFRGDPFATWAGDVAVGGGAAYRREALDGESDLLASIYNPALPGTSAFKPGVTPRLTINGFPATKQGTLGAWHTGNNIGSAGSLDVAEVFAETLVPLLRDQRFAQQLDLNAAVRYADYEYGGGQTNWKVGLVYSPFEDLRFRSPQSRISAPNLADLFAGPSITLPGVTDPFRTGTTGQPETANFGNTITAGNIDLVPEVGDTFTVGAVYSPSWVEGFTVSLDYYDIRITDAIAQAGGQVIVNPCFSGNTGLCDLIVRNSDPSSFGAGNTVGPITTLYNPVLNIGTTHNAGYDLELGYRLPLAKLFDGRGDVFHCVCSQKATKNTTYVVGVPPSRARWASTAAAHPGYGWQHD